jgi:adenylate cyclase
MRDIYAFGPFRLDLDTMQLLRNNENVGLRPKAVQLLRVLVERTGMVVSYAELQKLVWGIDQTQYRQNANDYRNIKVTVYHITTALAEWARCIVNVPKRGYQFDHPEFHRDELRSPLERITLALLRFSDTSRNGDKGYLATGITAELKSSLAGIERLKIIDATPETIALLNPAPVYRLEGSVAGDEVRARIHIQLLTNPDRAIVWSHSYTVAVPEFLQLAPRVAAEVADAVKVKTNIEEITMPTRRIDGEAYKLYLRGLFHWSRPTEVDLFRAIEYFRAATVRQPKYAEAYGGMAHAYNLLGLAGFLRPDSAMPQAMAAAMQCLEVAPTSAEGLSALAAVEAYYHWNWAKAEDLLKRAIALKPEYETAHHVYAMACLMPQQRLPDALQEIRAAELMSPLSPFVATCVGIVQYYAQDYPGAIKQFDRALELQPHYHLAHWHRGWALTELQRFDEAADAMRTAVQASHSAPQVVAAFGHVLAAAGKHKECHSVLQQLKDLGAHTYVSPYDVAMIYISLGQEARGLRLLQHAVEQRAPALARLGVHPAFKRLKRNTIYEQLLTTINLVRVPPPPEQEPTHGVRKRSRRQTRHP